eukprot:3531027-Rhodomonas_salina.4
MRRLVLKCGTQVPDLAMFLGGMSSLTSVERDQILEKVGRYTMSGRMGKQARREREEDGSEGEELSEEEDDDDVYGPTL